MSSNPIHLPSPLTPIAFQPHHFTAISKQLSAKFNKLDSLQSAYKKHTEDCFYHAFEEVMDKMTSELGKAQQKYENIDKELETDDKVERLNRELYFFRNQCMHQYRQNQAMKDTVGKIKIENQMLRKEKEDLKTLLKKNVEENMRTRMKMRNTGDFSLFPATITHKLLTPSTRYKPGTAYNKDWASNGRSTSLKSSRNPPTAITIDQMFQKLNQEIEHKTLDNDRDEKLLDKLNEYELMIQKIKRRMIGPTEHDKRTTTNSTDRESKNLTQRPLRYSSKGKRIRRATPSPLPIDEISGYN